MCIFVSSATDRPELIELRPYQQTLLKKIENELTEKANLRLMVQLPTGGGKTVIAGALLVDWLREGRKAVWLTHRKELAEQTCRMLTDAGVSAITNINWTPGDDAPFMVGGIIILMAQTVGRRNARREIWKAYNSDDLLVIDEAHHAAAEGWTRAIRQWPGSILGMTATPWRLSEHEGFDHIFDDLLQGPQTADLQALDTPALCQAQVFMPPLEQRIVGGRVDRTGDYTEAGIEQANRHRPDIMTAGALDQWRKRAEGRPTIAYAVSVEHANNLAAIFNEAGVPSAVILGDSKPEERAKAIEGFRVGTIKVLVNVIVATEGFDLPDASCIIIARPTLSLALYLQMVGRGLRPKPDGGNCFILDLADNTVTHGLPDERREWTLKPRGTQYSGNAPVVWCPSPSCGATSPAASHNCRACGYSFGKDCSRCGQWRSDKRWRYETHCEDAHQLVCDLCHIDAHIQGYLPIVPPMDELVDLDDLGERTMVANDVDPNDELTVRLFELLKELLEVERHIIAGSDGARRNELARLIEERQAELTDDNELDKLFEQHMATLPSRPTRIQERRIFHEWEDELKGELSAWQFELRSIEDKSIDKQAIYSSAGYKAAYLLRRAAESMELLPELQNSSQPIRTLDQFPGVQDTPSNRPQGTPLPAGVPKRFYIRSVRKGTSAECDVYRDNRIVVLAGSTAAKLAGSADEKENPSTRQWYLSHEQQLQGLISKGVLVDAGEMYSFAKDQEFTSPSAAAALVVGSSVTGGRYLKDADGVPFAEYFPRLSSSLNTDRRPEYTSEAGRLRKGVAVPQRTFHVPIIESLHELGGKARGREIIEAIHPKIEHLLSDVDYEPVGSASTPRWENRVHWARYELVKNGLLGKTSERGVWELTEEGVAEVENQRE